MKTFSVLSVHRVQYPGDRVDHGSNTIIRIFLSVIISEQHHILHRLCPTLLPGGHDGPITTETTNQNSIILQYQSPGQRLPETHTHITSVENWRWRSENSWGITPPTPDPVQTQDRFHIGELSSSAERESASAASSSQTDAGGGKPKAVQINIPWKSW